MIDYFKKYNITIEEMEKIEAGLDKELITNFKVMENNVCEVLEYFRELGIKNLSNIIIYRPDLCFKTKMYLEIQMQRIDVELLKYIIDNNIDDLICFNI